MDGSYYQIISRTLAGVRPADERTEASVAVLAERMERLRSHGGLFAGIEFSPHVQRLRQGSKPMPVG